MYDAYNTIDDHPFIPDQAFLYFPQGNSELPQTDDFKVIYPNEGIKRLIFEGVEFTPQQNKKIERFKNYIQDQKIQLGKGWSKAYIYKFLQSAGCDYKRAIKEMLLYNQYQEKLSQKNYEQMRKRAEPILKEGPFYTFGRDSKFRPIVVFNIKLLQEMKLTQDEMGNALQYFLEFLYRNMLVNGQAQNLIGIIDIGYTSPFDLINTMKMTIGFMQNNYKYKMHSAYIIRGTRMFQMAFKIAKQFMKEDTIRKIRVVEGEVISELLSQCHPSQLEQKFGGHHSDLKRGQCFPPNMEQLEFNNPKAKTPLITVEEYREKYKKGELPGRKINKSFIVGDSQLDDIPMLNQRRPSMKNLRVSIQPEEDQEQHGKISTFFSKHLWGKCCGKRASSKEAKKQRNKQRQN